MVKVCDQRSIGGWVKPNNIPGIKVAMSAGE